MQHPSCHKIHFVTSPPAPVTPAKPLNIEERKQAIARYIAKMDPKTQARLLGQSVPRTVEPYTIHRPHPKQQVFLNLTDREALFGGAAGGGKSDCLLMAALQYVDVPGYSALILRKTYQDLVLPGAIMDRANTWLSQTPAMKRDGGKSWVFPSGARLQFGYLQHENDRLRYQSAEFQFIAFDELTQWPTQASYDYLFSRLRQPSLECIRCHKALVRDVFQGKMFYRHELPGNQSCRVPEPDQKVLNQYRPSKQDGMTIFEVPLRLRGATNPGGPGMEWVKQRFVDPSTRLKDAIFIRSLLQDNPSLNQKTYRESLEKLSPVDRERLLNGDWDVVESGDVFNRTDFKPVQHTPNDGTYWCRFWDLAATSGGGDYTVGALCCIRKDNTFHIEHVVRLQGSPNQVENTIRQTAANDGHGVHIRMEQEPGSSGKTVIDHYYRNVLVGYNFAGVPSTGDKITRATALASYVGGGYVTYKIARWNNEVLDEFQVFPLGSHDDCVDAVSGAFNYLALAQRARILV